MIENRLPELPIFDEVIWDSQMPSTACYVGKLHDASNRVGCKPYGHRPGEGEVIAKTKQLPKTDKAHLLCLDSTAAGYSGRSLTQLNAEAIPPLCRQAAGACQPSVSLPTHPSLPATSLPIVSPLTHHAVRANEKREGKLKEKC